MLCLIFPAVPVVRICTEAEIVGMANVKRADLVCSPRERS